MASAAMELKVLINILSSGTALNSLLQQTNQLSAALSKLQAQAGKIPPTPPAPVIPPAKQIDDTTKALQNMEKAINSVYAGLKFLAGGFLALQSVRLIKDLADTAARAQVLQTVLHVVGNNAGYTAAELDKADQKIQSLGISASASRQSLTQFIQAELELAKAPELARAAQDAAVILGTNSSDAFERLVTAVQTSNTLMLRHMGIIVSADSAYQRYALSIGKSVGQLTSAQRAQAFLNATLEQTKRISGSYSAAMGDVGKQLTSLDRLVTDLKTSLGNNLLPAYLAVVEELTIFLQNMELVADSMYGQGQGAKKLGEDIRFIAQTMRQAAEFVVKYREELIFLAGWWLLLSKVAVPLIGLLLRIQKAIAGFEIGAGFGAIIAGVGLLTGGIVVLGTALIAAELYSDKVNAAVGAVVGTVLTLVYAFGALNFAILQGAVAAVKTLFNIMTQPPSTWLKPWEDWYKTVTGYIKSVGDMWDNTKARFGQITNDPSQPTAEQSAQEKRNALLEKEGKLLAEVQAKTREVTDLRKAGTAAAITEAETQLKTLKDELVKTTAERKAGGQGLSEGQLAIEEQKIVKAKKFNEELLLTRKLEDAQKGSKFTYAGGIERSVQFLNELAQFNNLLDVYNSVGGKARVTTEQLFTSLRESSGAVKTKGDLQELATAVKSLRDAGTDATTSKRLDNLMFNATKQVEDELRRETERRDKDREQRFRNQEKLTADTLNHELDLLQTANAIAEGLDEQSYSRRGMELDKYFDRRVARTAAQGKKEFEIAQNSLSALQRERDSNIPRTADERRALDTKITEATQKLEELELEIQSRMVALGTAREDARDDKLKKSKQTMLDILAIYGDQDQALTAINNKYNDQLSKANTPEETQALLAEQRQEVAKKTLEYRERDLRISLESVRLRREELDAEQAILDRAKTRLQTKEDTGQITQAGAMRQRNALLQQQIEIDRQKVLTQTVELEKKRLFYENERFRIIAEMNQLAGKDTQFSPETLARINEELGATNEQIKTLEVGIINSNAKIEEAQGNIQLYGKQVSSVFADSLSDALAKSVTDVKNAAEAWRNIFDSVTKEIANIIAKNIAAGIVKGMHIEKGINALLGILPGFRGMGGPKAGSPNTPGFEFFEEGGVVNGPGTGTSDSIPAMVSAGEHIMPAAKTKSWLPVLEGIRTGRLTAYATGGLVQSIAIPSLIPRRYATGGVVVADGGAPSVQTGGGGVGSMVISLHPDALNMSLRDWLEHEVVRQHGRR